MLSKSQLLFQQRLCAEALGLKPDARGYLATVEGNWLQPLTELQRFVDIEAHILLYYRGEITSRFFQ